MRKWIDVEPGEYDRHSFEVSKNMISLLRHDRSILREKDGAVQFKILAQLFCSTIRVFPPVVNSSNKVQIFAKKRWSQDEISVLFGSSFCRDYSTFPSNSRPFWRKSNGSSIARQRVVTKRLHRVHHPRWKLPRHALHQTGFFTAVNPMFSHPHKQRDYDVTKPRIAVYKQNWKIHQKRVYWANLRVAQKEGLPFCQIRSNAIIFHKTLAAACIERVVVMSSEEVLKKQNVRISSLTAKSCN